MVAIRAQRNLLFVAVFLLATVAVIPVMIPPASSFEVSIYNGFSIAFWISFIVLVMCAMFVIFLSATTDHYLKRGFGTLLAAWMIFLSLPKHRGYLLFGRSNADILTHLGFTRSILDTGGLAGDNFYPALHLLMAALNLIGVEFWSLRLVVSLVFTSLYLLGVFIFVRRFTTSRQTSVLTLFAASVPLFQKFHVTVQPSVISWMVVPLLLSSVEGYRQSGRREWILVFFVLSMLLIFFHPITAVVVILALVVYTAAQRMYRSGMSQSFSIEDGRSVPLTIILISALPIPIWYLASSSIQLVFTANVISIVETANIQGQYTPIVENQAKAATERGLTTIQVAVRFVELYGPVAVYGGIASIVSLGVCYRIIKGRASEEEFASVTHFGTGGAFALIFFFLPLVIGNAIRVGRYAILFATVLVGMGLALIYQPPSEWQLNAKSLALVSAVILICLMLPVATMNVYYSNYHLTEAENSGVKWVHDYHDYDERVYTLQVSHKHSDAILGRHVSRGNTTSRVFFQRWGPTRPDLFPRHLGYENSDTAVQSFGEGYLVTKDHDRHYIDAYYEEQREGMTYYTDEDVNRLGNDVSASKIHSNGGWETWQLFEPNS